MKVITISREYGAGGHSIGQKVAQELGIEFYDRDILRGTAKAAGIDMDDVEAKEESITRAQSFVRFISPISYDDSDVIYNVQREVITDIARKGPCVILGRCADVILEEAGIDTLDVYIYADDIHRASRVRDLLHTDNATTISKTITKMDHDRHAYYTYHTGRHWGDPKNYNLMVDSGALGYETCVKMICDAARSEED